MVLGYMDWQYRFGADWNRWIIAKMILAVFLCVALGVVFVLGKKDDANPKTMMIAYAVCLGIAVGLGFCGGELQYA